MRTSSLNAKIQASPSSLSSSSSSSSTSSSVSQFISSVTFTPCFEHLNKAGALLSIAAPAPTTTTTINPTISMSGTITNTRDNRVCVPVDIHVTTTPFADANDDARADADKNEAGEFAVDDAVDVTVTVQLVF